MSAAALKRLVPVGWTGGVRALVDRLAGRHVFEASESQRDEIARRAEAFLASSAMDDASARDLKFDLAASDWKTRATAASRLSAAGAWTPWSVAGSSGVTEPDGESPRGDARLASAIFVAARETLLPDVAAVHGRALGSARIALTHEREGARHWDEAARPLVAEFARNARVHGADRRVSALRALAAAVHVKGRAMQASSAEDPFLIGSAASTLLRDRPEASEDGAPSVLEELVRVIASLNDARAELWDDADGETPRLMGASAAIIAFGRGAVSAPTPHGSGMPAAFAHLPDGIIRTYGRLTAAEAASAIDDEAADPRLDADRRRRLETLADALRRSLGAHAVSCAEALGAEAPEARVSEPGPGMKAYRAALEGRRRPLVCTGKNGRAVRCHAIADGEGAHVGYLAYDALSREFGGRPLYAVYGPDGGRYGYAWADERPVIRRGEPEQGFRTAPGHIPV